MTGGLVTYSQLARVSSVMSAGQPEPGVSGPSARARYQPVSPARLETDRKVKVRAAVTWSGVMSVID